VDTPFVGYANINEAIKHHLEFENLRVRTASLRDLAGEFEMPEAFDLRLTNCKPQGAVLNDRSVLFMGTGCEVTGRYTGGRRALVYARNIAKMENVTFDGFVDSRIVLMDILPGDGQDAIRQLTFTNLKRTTVEIVTFGPWKNEGLPLISNCQACEFKLYNIASLFSTTHLFDNIARSFFDLRNIGFVDTKESIFHKCTDCTGAAEFGLIGTWTDWVMKETLGGKWWFRIDESVPRHGFMATNSSLEFSQCSKMALGGKGFSLVDCDVAFDRCEEVEGDLLFIMCDNVRVNARASKLEASTAVFTQSQNMNVRLSDSQIMTANVVGSQITESAFTFLRSKIESAQSVWTDCNRVRVRQDDTQVQAGTSIATSSTALELRYENVQEQAGSTAYDGVNGLSHKWRNYQLQAGADGIKASNVRGFWENVNLNTGADGVNVQEVSRWFIYSSAIQSGGESFKATGGQGYYNLNKNSFQKEFTIEDAQYVRMRDNSFQKQVKVRKVDEISTWRNTHEEEATYQELGSFETKEDEFQKDVTFSDIKRLTWIKTETQKKLTVNKVEWAHVQNASWQDALLSDLGETLILHSNVEAPEIVSIEKVHHLKLEGFTVNTKNFNLAQIAHLHSSWSELQAAERMTWDKVSSDRIRYSNFRAQQLSITGERLVALDSTFEASEVLSLTDLELDLKDVTWQAPSVVASSCQGDTLRLTVNADNQTYSDVVWRWNDAIVQGESLTITDSRFLVKNSQGTFAHTTLRSNPQLEWRDVTWNSDLTSEDNNFLLVRSHLEGSSATFTRDHLGVSATDLRFGYLAFIDLKDFKGRQVSWSDEARLTGTQAVDLVQVIGKSVVFEECSGRLARMTAESLTVERSGRLNFDHLFVTENFSMTDVDEGRILAVNVSGNASLTNCRNVLWRYGEIGGTLSLYNCQDVGVADVQADTVVVESVSEARCGLVKANTVTVTQTTGFFTALEASTVTLIDCPVVAVHGGRVDTLTASRGSLALENMEINSGNFSDMAGLRTFAVQASSFDVSSAFWIGFGGSINSIDLDDVAVELCGVETGKIDAKNSGLNLVSVSGSDLDLDDSGALLTRSSFGSALLSSAGLMIVQGGVGSVDCDLQSAVHSISGNASIEFPFRTFDASRGKAIIAAGGRLGFCGGGMDGYLQGSWDLEVEGDVVWNSTNEYRIESANGGSWTGGCVRIPRLDADEC